jgi:hypothetical protein
MDILARSLFAHPTDRLTSRCRMLLYMLSIDCVLQLDAMLSHRLLYHYRH